MTMNNRPLNFSVKPCPLCGNIDNRSVLQGRPDYEYGVPFQLNYLRCGAPSCQLVFGENIPGPEVIQSFYSRYSTHQQSRKSGSLMARFGDRARHRKLMQILGQSDLKQIKVLDFGSGSGAFLTHLKTLGIQNAYGYDFDPEACRCAREAGLTAFSTEEEMRQSGPYDFIFLNHVIEHLAAPVQEVTRLTQHLAPGGRLILRTPNGNSLLARLFGSRWRGWETPRHLHIFNRANIAKLVTPMQERNVTVIERSTSNAMFAGVFHESFHAPFWRNNKLGKLGRHLLCFPMFAAALVLNALSGDHGEEVLFVLQDRRQ